MQCNCDHLLDSSKDHYYNCNVVWDESKIGYPCPKNHDGTLRLRNPHLQHLERDFIYHLGLDTGADVPAMFGDVKFVCMGGTKHRMREFALHIRQALGLPDTGKLENLTKHAHRYAMYKVGPVISVSHGIGIPSMSILLQEMFKLLYYARAKDPVFFRIGTSGGLGVPPGSVVVSSWGLNGTLEKSYDIPVLGKVRKLPSFFDERLCREVQSVATNEGYTTYIGGTMAADDFYRGQARLDGPFCDHTEADKISFLRTLSELGVKNIEMEATAFAAYTREAGVRAADVCVTLLDRLQGDQVTSSKATMLEWQNRPIALVGSFIVKCCKRRGLVHGSQ
ncbi:uridine phosphorylase 1-like [Cydia fagiglandana]|uniref:uridine phosphorylase 1-like n=1 Tax=Cydia fagiglandana TaxID=1458189 RepID=UPI002FEE161E